MGFHQQKTAALVATSLKQVERAWEHARVKLRGDEQNRAESWTGPNQLGESSQTSSVSYSQSAHRLSPYNAMVIQSYEVSNTYCMVAAFSNWIFLAGFVVFPGTFTSLGQASLLSESQAGKVVQQAVRHIPLLVIAILCCLAGSIGIGVVAWHLRRNYVWLSSRIFLPSLLNSIVGLVMSLVNIYTARGGNWSITAIITVSIISSWGVIMGSLLIVCEFWFLRKLRNMP